MPTRKISDEKDEHKPCFHPDHNPPSHMVFKPGTYEHECTGCGNKIVFVVRGIYCEVPRQVHYVDVGDIPPQAVEGYIKAVSGLLNANVIPTRKTVYRD